MEEAPKTEVVEISTDLPKTTKICPDPNCLSCTMIRNQLAAFESAVAMLHVELEKENRSLPKIDLLAGVAMDSGNAFARIDRAVDLSHVAVDDAKNRFIKAAMLMNSNYEKIKFLQSLAGVLPGGVN